MADEFRELPCNPPPLIDRLFDRSPLGSPSVHKGIPRQRRHRLWRCERRGPRPRRYLNLPSSCPGEGVARPLHRSGNSLGENESVRLIYNKPTCRKTAIGPLQAPAIQALWPEGRSRLRSWHSAVYQGPIPLSAKAAP